jgi:hypothetical protein
MWFRGRATSLKHAELPISSWVKAVTSVQTSKTAHNLHACSLFMVHNQQGSVIQGPTLTGNNFAKF